MKFGWVFMGEYCNMVTVTCGATLLFLGGWTPLFPAPYSNAVPVIVFLLAGLVALYFGINPVRPKDRRSLPIAVIIFLGLAWLFASSYLVAVVQTILMVLVCVVRNVVF